MVLTSLALWATASPFLLRTSEISLLPPEPLPLGGYTARKEAPFSPGGEDLKLRVVVLEQQNTKIAIASAELLTIPESLAAEVRKRLPATLGLFLAATHTHCAPDSQMLNERMKIKVPGIALFSKTWLEWYADRIALGIKQAIDAPAKTVDSMVVRSMLLPLNRARRPGGRPDPEGTLVSFLAAGSARPSNPGETPGLQGERHAFDETPGLRGERHTPGETPGLQGKRQTPGETPGLQGETHTLGETPGLQGKRQTPGETPGLQGETHTLGETPGLQGLGLRVTAQRAPSPGSPELTDLSLKGRGEAHQTGSGQLGAELPAWFHYAAHATFHDSDRTQTSGDWPGRVAERMGAAVLQGAIGDVSPRAPGVTPEERIASFAETVAKAIPRVQRFAGARSLEPFRWLELPFKLDPVAPHPDFARSNKIPDALARVVVGTFAPATAKIFAFRIGKIAVIGVPGEPSGALGWRIRNYGLGLGFSSVMVVSHVNGWIGYVLEPADYDRGGYEATLGFHGRMTGERVVEAGQQALLELSYPGKVVPRPAAERHAVRSGNVSLPNPSLPDRSGLGSSFRRSENQGRG